MQFDPAAFKSLTPNLLCKFLIFSASNDMIPHCTGQSWPELEKVLKDHGVSNYSIFLHPETRQLFGYAEIENEEQWASAALRGVAKGGGNTWGC